ncbi:hypothetical protein [Pseudactinotalea suaedae]|uniref:hypothetical protein n=1 Tax=Pseudactinotalea suaedae TaxID=1524924 RepID=UPI0019D55D6E|nr:hypothetical protein [Pseudactinotalea suaedae]
MVSEQVTRHPVPNPPDGAARPADRLTVVGGAALVAIAVLHTLVFIAQPWWAAWLAGPFRDEQLPVEAVAQFWALPGSFVVAGALLGLSIIGTGRRGAPAALHVPIAIGLWAALCIWIVGPSGFVLLLAPAVLLLIASLRARRRGTDRATR